LTNNGDGTATLAGTPAAASNGSYPITITAANGVGVNATQTFTLTVNPPTTPPVITSAGATTLSAGHPGTFTVTTSGFPAPTLTATSSPALPSGVTVLDNGNGTATLAGTPAAGSEGTYMVTVTATSSAGTAIQSFTLTVDSGLTFTSANAVSATAGKAFSFTAAATGSPTPALSLTGTLPSGVTFTANGNGTATLAGTPAPTASGPYPLTVTATNASGTTSQALTLTVDQTPGFTSASAITETAGTAFTFAVSTEGYPTPALTGTGLPTGVTFSDNGNGTATLSGTTAVVAGTYSLNITAANAGGTAGQTIILTSKAAGTTTPVPTFTSAAAATATAGKSFTFTVTTLGGTTTTVTGSGILPAGVSFTSNVNGTATLSGTPSAGSGGSYPITFTAKNASGTTTQSFVLTVDAAPTITTAAAATAKVGSSFSFTVKTTGVPQPALTEVGALPQGVTWVDEGNGTAQLTGSPRAARGGVYRLTVTAANSFGSVSQSFTLTVNQAPAITSAPAALTMHGRSFTFTFTTTGFPSASVTHTGTVRGLTFISNGNGTATLSGTPATAGVYVLSITARNAGGSATQWFILFVA